MIWCDAQWSPDVQIAAGRILYHVEFFTLSDSTCHDVAQGNQSSGSELTDGFPLTFPQRSTFHASEAMQSVSACPVAALHKELGV